MSSKIEWTEDTWNPLLGCTKVSPGCKNCYAIRTAWIRMHNPKMADRYAGTVEKTATGALNWTGKVNVVDEAFYKPLRTKKPTMFFINSMSDLFHEAVPMLTILEIFQIMASCPQHTFQVLTKRPERMLEFTKQLHYIELGELEHLDEPSFSYGPLGEPSFAPNIWLGVSVENQTTADERIPLLLQVPAAVRFLSCEPLLGPVDLEYPAAIFPEGPKYCCSGHDCGCGGHPVDPPLIHGIDWVICGGESGPGARPMHPDWARSLRDQCKAVGVPFFFKQWGEYLPFEETAQQPFWRRCSDGEEFDGHQMNFTDFDNGGGKRKGGSWMDPIEALEYCDISGECMFFKTGKKEAGRLLDGREWSEMPS